MAGLIVIALRLLIWLLLSADLEAANVAIGLAVAMALPLPRRHRQPPLSELGRSLLASLRAIPQAYIEAVQLLWRRPGREREERLPVEYQAARPVAALVFLDVFRITLTPLTIALGLDPSGRLYRVHRLDQQRAHGPQEGR